MFLSKRQENILNYLIQADEFTTAKELAIALNVSEKTVYREIKELKENQANCMGIIINHIGKGFKIDYDTYIKKFTIEAGKTHKQHSFSLRERREQMFIYLLFLSPQKTSVIRLSELYMISSSSILNDLGYIENILKNTDIKLEKGNQGTFLLGEEIHIRELLKSFIIKVITNNDYSYNLISLQDYFIYEDISFARSLLSHMIAEKFCLEDPYYINMLVYILIAINRIKNGNHLDSLFEEEIDATIDTKSKKVSVDMIDKIAVYTMTKLNKNEMVKLYYLIASSRFSRTKQASMDDSRECIAFIDLLINKMVEKCSAPFFDNNELRKALIPHVKPLIMRLRYHINIHNPLLDEIKAECNFLFNILKNILADMANEDMCGIVGDDEIGYLTLYFQYSLEQHLQSLKVVIVCSTGIGTSHLLKGRILRAFPKWKVVDIVSSSKVKEIRDLDKIDLLLTTINLDSVMGNITIPVVHVSAFFNEKDIDNVLKITRRRDCPEGFLT
jgi:activator of the mannose operon (transcriptional antiterminator)